METAELTTTNILSLFETTKEQRASFVQDLVSRLEEGEADPLKIHLQVKAMEDIITQLTSKDEKKNKSIELAKKYNALLIECANRYGSKAFDFMNAKFETKETGVKYNYEKCGDPELAKLEIEAERAAKKLKDRQEFLKTVSPSGLEVLVGDEIVTLYPPSKTSTTTLTTTLK